ncbi:MULTISPECIES: class II fructose-bisphosphate aldolase [unclassified Arthrobacter]|uniref:class II fructose-bisphosphate aldolase n=1 Tax=unclassified Arthrobacter TaxID=235627 RepID=UPI00159E1CAA|nr:MULTISPECIES: class II fructose-bisphosphate aldolase [unclassified Arthrobacter]MCQ9165217.1 class II fructose-bisphosphate aldolase [Arthrobacter sp. STN4]NVM98049.1 class II fructose-bisphosphate aldolase [Arthrobacter sp. SDTb3-6]
MPIATPDEYSAMLDTAKAERFAYPAINVTSSQTLNAALRGFAEAESDGIIQVSVGTAQYLSGAARNRMAGSLALAAYAHEVAPHYNVRIALHTDHCPKANLDDWVLPLLEHSIRRVKEGRLPLYQSHMWDGSQLPLAQNLQVADRLLALSGRARTILEVEVGVVGGEEDGLVGAMDERLYTTVDEARQLMTALGTGDRGRYLAALTFGNVHGAYKPGKVKLRPALLGEIQAALAQETGIERPLDLVFHGGSGSTAGEISEAVRHGVVKMNIDSDTQYAFTRSIAGYMLSRYDEVLKVDGEVGVKKSYDPRSWGTPAEQAMAGRVMEAARQLGSAGRSLK